MANILIVYSNGITCILNKHFQIKNDGENQYLKNCLKNQYQYQKESQEAYLVFVQQWGDYIFTKSIFK